MKPLIAVTSRRQSTEATSRIFVNKEYIDAITKADGIAVLLVDNDPEAISEVLKTVSGVLITGGIDIDPQRYGQSKEAKTVLFDSWQDDLDMSTLKIAAECGLPILGICRGLQSINVYHGGTLIQDIPSRYEAIPEDRHFHSANTAGYHEIEIAPTSRLAQLLGPKTTVNSYHHQALDHLPAALSVTALSDDGIIEAVEGDNILAVQWHPERMSDHQLLFDDLIARAHAYQQKKSDLHHF